MRIGCVITACQGREENLRRTLDHLRMCEPGPSCTVVVFDGCDDLVPEAGVASVCIPKHTPGQEQPRNVGVRRLRELDPESTHVLFLDSDLVFKPDLIKAYQDAYEINPVHVVYAPDRWSASVDGPLDRVMIGPYEFMEWGKVDVDESLYQDIRWASFREHGPDVAFVHDLGPALACFGGNLVWPIDEFQQIGGFSPEFSHGRVEDGELGLRAAAAGVPMTLVRAARGWHVRHPRNEDWIAKTNAREVPMLNARHPWVEERGLILTESDGARFDWECTEPECDLVLNSHEMWNHLSQHRSGEAFTFLDPGSVRHKKDVQDEG